MQRHRLEPRPDWREHALALGFAFAEIAGEPYWDETACWEFTADEIDTLEAATAELERLARLAADDAVRHDRHEMLGIPQADRIKLFEWSNSMIAEDDPELRKGPKETAADVRGMIEYSGRM